MSIRHAEDNELDSDDGTNVSSAHQKTASDVSSVRFGQARPVSRCQTIATQHTWSRGDVSSPSPTASRFESAPEADGDSSSAHFTMSQSHGTNMDETGAALEETAPGEDTASSAASERAPSSTFMATHTHNDNSDAATTMTMATGGAISATGATAARAGSVGSTAPVRFGNVLSVAPQQLPTDNASVLTIASSSKARHNPNRRNSHDTSASIRALPPLSRNVSGSSSHSNAMSDNWSSASVRGGHGATAGTSSLRNMHGLGSARSRSSLVRHDTSDHESRYEQEPEFVDVRQDVV